MFTLLVYHDLPKTTQEYLRDHGIAIVRGKIPDERGMCADIAGCHALVAFEQPENGINRAIIDAGESLQLIARRGVGYETVDIEYAAQKGIYVTNTPGINHVTVAEATVMLMLACARNMQRVGERFRALRGAYPFFSSNADERGFELHGKTVGLIGCGRIGAEVAKIARLGFGMRVIGYDPFMAEISQLIDRCKSREEVFSHADFVSLHLPLNATTRHSVGAAEFECMKRSAYLINTARGGLVCEDELIAALDSGKIRGAGLDVFAHEPPGDEITALFGMEQVVLTPHNASFTKESLDNAIASVVESVLEVAHGKPPANRVNAPAHPRNSKVSGGTP